MSAIYSKRRGLKVFKYDIQDYQFWQMTATIVLQQCTATLALQRLYCNNCIATITLQQLYCNNALQQLYCKNCTAKLHCALVHHKSKAICSTNKGNNTCRSEPASLKRTNAVFSYTSSSTLHPRQSMTW